MEPRDHARLLELADNRPITAVALSIIRAVLDDDEAAHAGTKA